VVLDSTQLPYRDVTPIALQSGVPSEGSITSDAQFAVYSIEGEAGDVISISMSAVSPSNLDTKLFLISPNGVEIADNDDAVSGETDSAIANFTLPLDGTYLVVATRFGMQFGGTVGSYRLVYLQLN
jgi:hypothetical protein